MIQSRAGCANRTAQHGMEITKSAAMSSSAILKKSLYPIFLFMAFCIFSGCGGGADDAGTAATPSADSFKIAVISDVHVRLPGNPDDTTYDNAGNISLYSSALNRIKTNHSNADLVIVNGDLTGCLFSNNPDDYGVGTDNPAETFKSMIDALGMPYYVILGNHDYEDGFNTTFHEGTTASDPAVMETIWKKVLGIDPYYSFVHKGVRFIMLNSTRGPRYNSVCASETVEKGCTGSFDDDQMDWLESQLANSEPCLVFLHHPLITDHNALKSWSNVGQVRSGDRFYTIARTYKSRIKGIFVGHGHFNEHDTLEGVIPVYETAATGDYNGSSTHIRVVWMDPNTGVMITD